MLVILFSTALFCGVVTMIVDRFLSIHFHLRYQGCCWSDLNMGSKYVFSFAGIVGISVGNNLISVEYSRKRGLFRFQFI